MVSTELLSSAKDEMAKNPIQSLCEDATWRRVGSFPHLGKGPVHAHVPFLVCKQYLMHIHRGSPI